MVQILWGIGGMIVIPGLAFALSLNRRAINPRTVLGALAIQISFGVIVLYWETGKTVLQAVSRGVQAVINSANEGIGFVFGPILPGEGEGPVFAFQVLPVIIFFASLTTVLYHLNVLQWVVRIIGGALSTVAGSVLVGYSLLGAPLEYLIAASFMAAPAGLLMAKMVLPETEEPESVDEQATGAADAETGGEDEENEEVEEAGGGPLGHQNVIDAAAAGAADGLYLALNVGAMLIAFISLIALFNLILGSVGGLVGFPDLTFQLILGWIFAPLMFLIGVPWEEAIRAGRLGQKLILNEFVAFANFAPNIGNFSDKAAAIITFSLTGFANFGSLAILLGGLGGIAPNRRPEIAKYGIRAVLAGTLANLMSATIAGMLIG